MTTQPPARLIALRQDIDAIDDQLICLLAKRFDAVQKVVTVKRDENLPAFLPERVDEVLARVRAKAEAEGFPPNTAEKLWRQLIDDMIAYEETALK